MVELNIGSNGKLLSVKNDKVALIDADTMVFATCITTEVEHQVFPKGFYSDSEWEELEKLLPHKDAEAYWTIDVDEALEKIQYKLDDILEATGCKEYELHFTAGRESFRYSIFPEYKANRKSKRLPVGISKVREAVVDKYGGEIHTFIEADDAVVAKYDSEKYILVAVDKDVLNNAAGKHWNYYNSNLHGIIPKWVEVSEDEVLKYKYIQTLTGDKTDNIIGLDRVGIKTAEKLLKDTKTEKEMWDIVVKKYEEKGRTKEDALLNMRLVGMHQVAYKEGKYKLTLWKEPV